METDIIYNEDCLEGLSKIPDKSIDLIVIDPPYFQVMKTDWKGQKYEWDNQWKTLSDYLNWIVEVCKEVKRILKLNGSFYIFADDKICAYIQVELDKMFKLENSITWVKPNNLTIKGWNLYRSYSSITEKILFYSNETEKTGLQEIYNNPSLFMSIKNYLREEKNKAGLTNKKLNLLFSEFYNKVGCRDRSVIEHYFGNNQWVFPTEEIYKEVLQKTGFFRREYEELRREYEELRRYFNPKENFTDVWTFNIMGGKESVNHPTQKPLAIIRRIIETSSKEGQIVLDCFMGSGTTALACKELNRRYIGFEKDPKYCKIISKRLSQQTLSNLSATPRTLPNGNPNGEFNKDLTDFQKENPKCPSDTSLNPNIKRNMNKSLAGLVQPKR
jgi:DNA modification methylase